VIGLVVDLLLLGRHHLIVVQYDYGTVRSLIERFCAECSGATWRDVAVKKPADLIGRPSARAPGFCKRLHIAG